MSTRRCIRDQIRDAIVERTLDGTYPPGMRLRELTLAAEFQVSQGPVREALRELEALGLVHSEHYRGTRVRAANLRELHEAYELRAMIEERSAQLAVPCAPEVLGKLEAHLDAMRRTLKPGRFREHVMAATAFHHTLICASGNAMFVRVWEAMHWEVRMRIAIQQLWDRGAKLETFLATHGAILRALKARDGARAGSLLRALMNDILKALEPLVNAPEAVRKPAVRRARAISKGTALPPPRVPRQAKARSALR